MSKQKPKYYGKNLNKENLQQIFKIGIKNQRHNKSWKQKLYTYTFRKTYDKIIYMKFDLEERTTKFGADVILFCQKLKQTPINQPLINQIVRSATSIGANYYEANEAGTKNDFYNKIYISKKEANETKHWLQLIAAANPDFKTECRILWSECHEITLILSKIVVNSRNSTR